VAYQPKNFGAPDIETIAVSPVDARVAPLDKLQVNVFQVADLSGEYQVDSAGQISFPLIGSVTAAGRTTADLSQVLAARLGAKYLQSPKVQVSIKESADQTVTVDGSVRQPGVFPIKGATTLMKAVALARGASEDANPKNVIVFRTIKGERMAGAFDLAAIRKAEAQDPIIYGNDIIIVDGSRARSLFRDVMSSIPLLGILRPF
jgi:polysaccharide export outer membrane protein